MRRIPRVVGILMVALLSCRKAEPVEISKAETIVLPPVKVTTGEVLHQPMPSFLTLTGTVTADRQSDVAANVAGRVTATYVERGMPVKAGQAIAVVDSKAAGFQAAAAQAQSQAAQTQVQLARQECDRADTLFSQGAIAKSEFDRMKSQCTAQLYQANAAQANADLAGKLAGDTVIRAPIDGVVGERFVHVGEYVQPPTKVASIFDIHPVRVSISVPESAVGLVREGQMLNIEVSAWPGREFPATVRFVSPALRASTRDLLIEATAKNDEGLLRPGMFAVVRLMTEEKELPTVPLDAVVREGTVKRIFLARQGSAFEMVIKTGVTRGDRIAVYEPLEAGVAVIRSPPPGLRDGSSIQ